MKRNEINYYRDDHLINNMTEKENSSTTTPKKADNLIGSLRPRDFRKYYDYIEDSLYPEFFSSLVYDLNQFDNDIDQKRFVRSLFLSVFSEENFSFMLKYNHLLPFLNVLYSSSLLELDKFSEIIKSSISIEEASKSFSMLVVSNNLDVASYFLNICEHDLSQYPVTLETLYKEKNEDAILFLLGNMKNIHFGKGEILRQSYNLSIEFIDLLIKEYGFDLNSQNSEKLDLLTLTVYNDNLKLFSSLLERYSDTIIFSNDKLFRAVETQGKEMFLQQLLKSEYLKPSHIEQIGLYLFADNTPERLHKTNIYSLFFNHKSFDDHIFTLGQGYFIYGLLSKLGITAKKIDNEAAKPLVHILDEYLSTIKSDTVPDSPHFHIVGAALQVANICNKQSTSDSCILILRKFPKYINSVNPNGQYPIEQVADNQSLERIVLNFGGKKIKKDSLVDSFIGLFKSKQNNIDNNMVTPTNIAEYIGTSPSASNIRDKIRVDFEKVKQIISSPSFDFEIKILCENMFLKADRLAIIIEKNSLVSFTSEIHFLSENFSNYLLKSIETYHKINTSGIELEIKDSQDKAVDSSEARRVCLSHISLLTEQLNLLIDNVSSCVEEEALLQMKVRTKFLEEKFSGNKTEQTISDTVNVLTSK